MRKVIEFKPQDNRIERIKQCDEWIERDCIKLIKILKSEPERYAPLTDVLSAITLFGIHKQGLLKGGVPND